MSHKIVHFEIIGTNGPKLREFYANLFGWNMDMTHTAEMDYGIVNSNESGLAGGIGGGQAKSVTFYIAVPDLQAALDQAVALGGQVVVPPTEIPNMVTFAQFADIEGNVIGLVKDEPR